MKENGEYAMKLSSSRMTPLESRQLRLISKQMEERPGESQMLDTEESPPSQTDWTEKTLEDSLIDQLKCCGQVLNCFGSSAPTCIASAEWPERLDRIPRSVDGSTSFPLKTP